MEVLYFLLFLIFWVPLLAATVLISDAKGCSTGWVLFAFLFAPVAVMFYIAFVPGRRQHAELLAAVRGDKTVVSAEAFATRAGAN